jgi:hypothetical protein
MRRITARARRELLRVAGALWLGRLPLQIAIGIGIEVIPVDPGNVADGKAVTVELLVTQSHVYSIPIPIAIPISIFSPNRQSPS